MEGVAPVKEAGRRARRGAGGAGAGRAQVGQREEGAGPLLPPLAPPAVRMRPLLPVLRLFTGQSVGAVGVGVDSETGRHPMVVPTVPAGGGAPAEGGWSRGGSSDRG